MVTRTVNPSRFTLFNVDFGIYVVDVTDGAVDTLLR